MSESPKAPVGAGAAGKALWASVTGKFELEQHELQLLTEAVRTADVLADLHAAVRRDGPLVDTPQGVRAHPAVVESRQQRITLARLLAALQLPVDDEEEPRKGRPGARGIYTLRPGKAS